MKIFVLSILVIIALVIIWKIAKLLLRLLVLLFLLFIISLFLLDEEKSHFYHPIVGQEVKLKGKESCQVQAVRFQNENKSVGLYVELACGQQVMQLSQNDFFQIDKKQETDLVRWPFYYPLKTFHFINQIKL